MVVRRFLVAAVLLCAACGASDPSVMTPVPPPASWARDIATDRLAKDETFRTDADSPLPKAARSAFKGLPYYPLDPSWRYGGMLEPYEHPERMTIVTTTGEARPCERWGRVRFERDGRVLMLQVYRLLDLPARPGGAGLFLPFKDVTSGKETYAAGRYVDLEGDEGGPYTLDFNRAYDPSCAYGEPERFQCPRTPDENTLDVAVAAGERGPAHE
ncbi:MAG TPA: DUF1684 domain-containing protein [Candidatus Polarisedimenticolaceae bacterium]|nr:DUF1684 domain-containing protein [Candidatus Polarisedimenticolaceae bacterium]